MSIFIRLQNLPLLAKSEDIRHFFGGLWIPDGGIYITGGELGDAFIAFTSEDDAYLAMQKSGNKIMDTPVNLSYSSESEMHQEIERIRKQNSVISRQRPPDEMFSSHFSDDCYYRSKSPSRDRRSYSCYRRSPSPINRSSSPRRRPESSEMSFATRRSRSRSPVRDTGMLSDHHLGKSLYFNEKNLGSEGPSKSERDELSFWDIQAQFEQQKSASTLTAGINYVEKRGNSHHQPGISTVANSHVMRSVDQIPGLEQNSQSNDAISMQDGNLSPMVTSNMESQKHFASDFQSLKHTISLTPLPDTSPMTELPPSSHVSTPSFLSMTEPLPCSSFSPVNALPNVTKLPERPNENFYVTLSGLEPEWGICKLQNILMGIFIPDKNIKFDLNSSGSKTGTAYVKLSNADDFRDLLSHKTYFYKYKLISVSVCPDYVYNKHFTPETPFEGSLNSDKGIYYYRMKGIPVDVTSQDILDLFEGLEVVDLYISFQRDFKGQRLYGKAKENAYVAFGNKSDYQKAFSKNNHWFITSNQKVKLKRITKETMLKWKNRDKDLLLQSKSFFPVPDGEPVPGIVEKVFCTVLTGLPENITTKKIFSFFIRSGARPGKIHISLNDKQQCDGRAFVEFKNLQILKKACKVDGKRISKFVISVKEISHEEMLKSLNSPEAEQSQQVKTEHPNSLQTPGTSVHEIDKVPPVSRFPQEENFRDTDVNLTTIKVENVSDDHAVEPQGIPSRLFPERPLDVHSKTNVKVELESEARSFENNSFDSRKGSVTFPSAESYTFSNETRDFEKSCPRSLDTTYARAMNHAADRQWSASNMSGVSNSSFRQTSISNSQPYDGMNFDFNEAVVQIKNIDPVLTIPDLMAFLSGFDIDANNIVRIFNHGGCPTADVLVTFRNHSDAERAIESLNGKFVNGVPVGMWMY